MKKRLIKLSYRLCCSILLLGGLIMSLFSCTSYEKAYSRTTSGEIIIKELPELKAIRTSKPDGQYFKDANGMFMKLFRYIKKNKVSMTVPVETRQDSAGMMFFIGKQDADKKLENNDAVEVITLPARTVASIGVMGSYNEPNFNEAKEQLEKWLSTHPDYEASGEAFGVYWNSPFVPGFAKKSEVNIPVRKRE